MSSWKITAFAPLDVVEAALVAHEEVLDWDPEIVIAGSEVDRTRPDEWQLEAWLSRKPRKADLAAISSLFSRPVPKLTSEKLPDADWITQSQQGLEPIRAGRFHVHTPDHPAIDEPGLFDFTIPAGQAFGTGQHETTAGCLAMLDKMKRRGVIVRNLADIGTGTGLLAFAALRLWSRAFATASDIDRVCADVVDYNAAAAEITVGGRAGEVAMVIADGMRHPVLAARSPYDLIIANILAGPLVSLTPEFSRALIPGGHLLLSGLLTTQEASVRRACIQSGMRLAARMSMGDWSVLWMRKRPVTAGGLRRRASHAR